METINFRRLQRMPATELKEMVARDKGVIIRCEYKDEFLISEYTPLMATVERIQPLQDLPIYNPFLHKKGDRVLVNTGGTFSEVVLR